MINSLFSDIEYCWSDSAADLLRENYHYDNICVAGSELISRVRIADEINRLSGNALHYFISEPDSEFYNNRPAITEMRSLFLYKNKILEEVSITKKMQEVLNL